MSLSLSLFLSLCVLSLSLSLSLSLFSFPSLFLVLLNPTFWRRSSEQRRQQGLGRVELQGCKAGVFFLSPSGKMMRTLFTDSKPYHILSHAAGRSAFFDELQCSYDSVFFPNHTRHHSRMSLLTSLNATFVVCILTEDGLGNPNHNLSPRMSLPKQRCWFCHGFPAYTWP